MYGSVVVMVFPSVVVNHKAPDSFGVNRFMENKSLFPFGTKIVSLLVLFGSLMQQIVRSPNRLSSPPPELAIMRHHIASDIAPTCGGGLTRGNW